MVGAFYFYFYRQNLFLAMAATAIKFFWFNYVEKMLFYIAFI
jgi:hypothetical protein